MADSMGPRSAGPPQPSRMTAVSFSLANKCRARRSTSVGVPPRELPLTIIAAPVVVVVVAAVEGGADGVADLDDVHAETGEHWRRRPCPALGGRFGELVDGSSDLAQLGQNLGQKLDVMRRLAATRPTERFGRLWHTGLGGMQGGGTAEVSTLARLAQRLPSGVQMRGLGKRGPE